MFTPLIIGFDSLMFGILLFFEFYSTIFYKLEKEAMIAAYVRVSTREQLQGYGIDAQEEKIKNYFKDIGISLEQVQFFRDPGVSAANKNRPAFESMMKFIRRNKITEVIIYKLDRLFRDLQQQIDVINEFKMRDVKLTCITEDLDLSSANGRLTTQMRSAFT